MGVGANFASTSISARGVVGDSSTAASSAVSKDPSYYSTYLADVHSVLIRVLRSMPTVVKDREEAIARVYGPISPAIFSLRLFTAIERIRSTTLAEGGFGREETSLSQMKFNRLVFDVIKGIVADVNNHTSLVYRPDAIAPIRVGLKGERLSISLANFVDKVERKMLAAFFPDASSSSKIEEERKEVKGERVLMSLARFVDAGAEAPPPISFSVASDKLMLKAVAKRMSPAEARIESKTSLGKYLHCRAIDSLTQEQARKKDQQTTDIDEMAIDSLIREETGRQAQQTAEDLYLIANDPVFAAAAGPHLEVFDFAFSASSSKPVSLQTPEERVATTAVDQLTENVHSRALFLLRPAADRPPLEKRVIMTLQRLEADNSVTKRKVVIATSSSFFSPPPKATRLTKAVSSASTAPASPSAPTPDSPLVESMPSLDISSAPSKPSPTVTVKTQSPLDLGSFEGIGSELGED